MEWLVKTFSQLTSEELYEILRLRVDVFVVEQQCPYPELDGKDLDALHVFARNQEEIQAYLRVLRPGVSFPEASLGRVVTRPRRQGLGTQLLQKGLEAAEAWLGHCASRPKPMPAASTKGPDLLRFRKNFWKTGSLTSKCYAPERDTSPLASKNKSPKEAELKPLLLRTIFMLWFRYSTGGQTFPTGEGPWGAFSFIFSPAPVETAETPGAIW